MRARTEWHLLVSEHAALSGCAERLEAVLESCAEGAPERLGGPPAKTLLEEFQYRLASHLASEEKSGVLEAARVAEPRFERLIQQLEDEHGELRARIDALAGAAAGASWGQLHAGFLALRRFLRAHEHAEYDLLQRVYLDDLGGGG